ncbi:hypothetical protein SCT_2043 [Sulfuricella sp. T08]|uniref:hypothetical protein n=1 Tax=Sulfuricella sp. T08 TaxID=1632857 RepID=UPI0006179C22|nr:hypothetical protein [Sulfuricella sp. T08]GAO36634.1 hypothetical protein SCT_2043 [Sulfuricella sp. T08]
MHSTVEIFNKTVRVEWSDAAESAMASRMGPLTVEMELYFSCLIRKKVRFGNQAHSREFLPVNQHLAVAFRPVMTKSCKIDRDNAEAPLSDFEIKNPAAFVPHWLKIDFRHGKWEGDFGFSGRE